MIAGAFTFIAGNTGPWRVMRQSVVSGAALASCAALDVQSGLLAELPAGAQWLLRGVQSNERYVTRAEKTALVAQQPAIGRSQATCAAFIPLRKSAAWWSLMQDERRAIVEERSKHIALGLGYLPAVARRLHHSRDLGEPFDFLTWFEYAPAHAEKFEELVGRLRETEEWNYVEAEIDLRLERAPS
jgi:chlorite dismutase